VTGRPRRCGWFDAVSAKRAVRVNGIGSIFVTKLDVLSGLGKLKIGVQYRLAGRVLDDVPVCAEQMKKVEVVYEELDGWNEDLGSVRAFDDLPETAKKFLKRLEQLTETALSGFSVGPDRAQTIVLDSSMRSFAGL
jgi:adenylosuccinate synthase